VIAQGKQQVDALVSNFAGYDISGAA
jgi:hypothetical protein